MSGYYEQADELRRVIKDFNHILDSISGSVFIDVGFHGPGSEDLVEVFLTNRHSVSLKKFEVRKLY